MSRPRTSTRIHGRVTSTSRWRTAPKVELRLLDGGWVCYQPLGWYAVQMPGTAFDALLKACGA